MGSNQKVVGHSHGNQYAYTTRTVIIVVLKNTQLFETVDDFYTLSVHMKPSQNLSEEWGCSQSLQTCWIQEEMMESCETKVKAVGKKQPTNSEEFYESVEGCILIGWLFRLIYTGGNLPEAESDRFWSGKFKWTSHKFCCAKAFCTFWLAQDPSVISWLRFQIIKTWVYRLRLNDTSVLH